MNNYLKRYTLTIIAFLFILFAAGCGTSNVESDVESVDDTNETEEVVFDEQEDIEEKEVDKEKGKEDKKDSIEKQNKENASQEESPQNKNQEEDTSGKSTEKTNKQKTSTLKKEQSQKKSSPSKASKSNKVNGKVKKENPSPQRKEAKSPPKKTESKPKQKTSKPKDTVTISIETGSVQGTILSSTKVPIKSGDTMLDATRRIVKEKGIQISVRGSGSNAYVEGINNLYEFDEGPLSGWVVTIDDVSPGKSTGAYPIEANQTIKWTYTVDYTK